MAQSVGDGGRDKHVDEALDLLLVHDAAQVEPRRSRLASAPWELAVEHRHAHRQTFA